MIYEDHPDPYDRDRQYRRRDVYRRRSSPSLIDAIDRARTPSAYAAPRDREFDDDRRQARPSRINYDDDDLWVMPDRHGQHPRTRHWTDPAPLRREPSWPAAKRHPPPRQLSPYVLDDYDDDSRKWERSRSRKTRPAPERRAPDDDGAYWDDSRSTKSRPRPDNYDEDSEPSRIAYSRTSDRRQAQPRRPPRDDDPDLRPRNAHSRPVERRSAPVPTPASSRFKRHRRARDDSDAESDALSVFAHIRTESDSGSSDNRDNFDDDQDDDDPVDVRSPTPVRQAPRPKRKKPATKPKPGPVRQTPPEANPDSGSSFTMGSSQASVQIEAIPPPGPQVAATDTTAIAAMLWTVDHLDRCSLGLTVVLSVVVVSTLITAMAAHEPALYVAVGVYALLWLLIHRESRALQEQIRNVHDHHAAMNAVQLAEINVIAVARRTIQATAAKVMRIAQVSAAGSIVFLVLLAGLAIWSATWASFALAIVDMMVSGAVAVLAPVQYRTIINTTDGMMSDGVI